MGQLFKNFCFWPNLYTAVCVTCVTFCNSVLVSILCLFAIEHNRFWFETRVFCLFAIQCTIYGKMIYNHAQVQIPCNTMQCNLFIFSQMYCTATTTKCFVYLLPNTMQLSKKQTLISPAPYFPEQGFFFQSRPNFWNFKGAFASTLWPSVSWQLGRKL